MIKMSRSSIGQGKRGQSMLAGRKRAVLAAACLMGLANTAHAASGTWLTNANGTWDGVTDAANWVGGIPAIGSGFTADFTQVNITADRTVTLGAPITIGNISFADLTTISNNWIINSLIPADTLTLDGTTPTITVNDATRTATIGAVIAGTAGLTKAGAGILSITVAPTESGLTTVSTGTLNLGMAFGSTYTSTGLYSVSSGAVLNLNFYGTTNLNAANSVSGAGTLQLSQGTIVLGNNSALGSTTINFSNAASTNAGTNSGFVMLSSSGGDRSIGNALFLNGVGGIAGANNFTMSGLITNAGGNRVLLNELTTGKTLTLSGGIALSGDATGRTLTLGGVANTVISAPVTNGAGAAGGLALDGSGTVTLRAANTYTGATSVQNGTYVIDTANGGAYSSTGTLLFGGLATTSLIVAPGIAVMPTLDLLSPSGSGSTISFNSGVNAANMLVSNGGGRIILDGATNGGSVNLTLGSGTINRAANGVLDVTTLGAGVSSLFTGGAQGAQNGIYPWISVNQSNFGTITGGKLSAFNTYSGTTLYSTGSNLQSGIANNLKIDSTSTGNINIAAGVTTANSILFADANPRTIDVSAGNTLGMGTIGTIMSAVNAGPLTIGTAPNVGTLRQGVAAGSELVLNNQSTNAITINSTIANNGNNVLTLNKAGPGKVILAGSNSFTGSTVITSGTLMLGSSSAINYTTNAALLDYAGGTLDMNGFNATIGTAQGSGAITNNSATTSILTVGIGNGTTNAQSQIITGNIRFVKVGTGQIQSQTPFTTYTGGTEIDDGTLRIGGNGYLGTGSVVFNDTDPNNAGGVVATVFVPNLSTVPANNTLTQDFNVPAGRWGYFRQESGGSALGLFQLNGNLTGAGTMMTSDSAPQPGIAWNMDATNFTGTLQLNNNLDSATTGKSFNLISDKVISATTHFDFTAPSGQTINIGWNPTNADYSTKTVDGTVQIGQLTNSVGAIATFRNNTANTTVTYQIGALNTSTTFGGNFINNVGTTALTKVGNGALTITGTNTYTGATTVNAGTLTMNALLGNTPMTVNGGTLAINAGAGTGNVIVNSTGNFVVNNSTVSAPSVTVNGGGAVYAIGSATLGTATAGGLVVAGGSSAPLQGGINMIDSSINTLNINSAAGTVLTLGGANAGDHSSLNFELGTSNTADRILLNNAAGAAAINPGGATVNVSAFGAWNGPGTYDLITAPGGGIDGTKFAIGSAPVGFYGYSFASSTATDLILTVTGVAMPTTAYWKGDVNGDWAGGSSANTNWATDAGGATDTQQLPGGISNVVFSATGAGNLGTTLNTSLGIQSLRFAASGTPVTVGGTGKLGLGANGLTVDSGGAANMLSVSTVSLDASQTWTNNSTSQLTVSSSVVGPGGLTVAGGGAGVVFLNGNNAYVGGTTLSTGGIVKLGNGNALGTGNLTMAGGTLDLNNLNLTVGALAGTSGTVLNNGGNSATITFNVASGVGPSSSATIANGTGTVAVVKTGLGSLTLAGVNTYTGGTQVTSGTLGFAADTALGGPTSPVIFDGVAGVIEPSVSGLTISRPIQVNTNAIGTISMTNGPITINGPINGAGTLNLSGANTATFSNSSSASTGTININTSTLKLGTNNPLGPSTTNITAGGTLDLNGHTFGSTGGTLVVASGANTGTVGVLMNSDTVNTAVLSGSATLNQPGASVLRVMGPGNIELDSTWNGFNDSLGSTSYLLKLGTSTLTIGGSQPDGQARIQIGTFDNTTTGGNVTVGGTVVVNKTGSATVALNTLRFAIVNSGTLMFGTGTISQTALGFGQIGGLRISGQGVVDLNGSSGTNSTVETLNNGDYTNFLNVSIGAIAANTQDFMNGTITNSSTSAATLTIGANNSTAANSGVGTLAVFTGNIRDGAGTVSIVKTGSGTFAITTNNGVYDNGLGAPNSTITAVDGNTGNTFTGGFYVNGGQAFIGSDDALGTGTIGLNGGELASFDTIARNFSNPVNLAGSAQAGDTTRTGTLNFNGNGFITANATLTTNSPVIMNGIIAGPSTANLIKSGASTLTLTASNTYTGGTSVNAGTLAIPNSNTLNNTAYVSVAAGGTLSLPGSYSTPSTLTIAGTGGVVLGGYTHGAGTINPGSGGGSDTAGTVSFANGLALNSGGSTFIDLSGTTTTSDLVAVTGGSLNMSGGKVELNFLSTPTGLPRTYTIATYGSESGALSNLTFESPRANFGTLDTGSSIQVTVTSYTAGNLTWSGLTAGNGQWDVSTTANWTNAASGSDKFFQLDTVNFIDAPATVQNNVVLNTQVAPTSVTVNNTNTAYTISGAGTITGATGITKTGSGALTITAATNYTGTTTVQGGRLVLGSRAWGPALTIGGSAGADVKGGRLVFDYTGTTTPAASVGTLLTAGYAQATKFSTGLIHSSTATATLGLGWVDNVAASQVSVAQTYYGDSNLDGTVNILDFNNLATNFGTSGMVWATGDFNYDGTVNVLDLNAVATNFGQSISLPAPLVLNGATPALGALVPEPASIGLIALGLTCLSPRRTRRNRSKNENETAGKN
jgi:fibronectin-binding autotransporter adhesin